MAAPLPGFTPPLPVSFLVLHLLLITLLLAGKDLRGNWEGGGGDDAGGRSRQHEGEPGATPGRCEELRPSRCTSERTHSEGCPRAWSWSPHRGLERGVVPACSRLYPLLLSPDTLQRTYRWPHLATAFVRAPEPCTTPGSDVNQRACEVNRPPQKGAFFPGFTDSPFGLFPNASSCCFCLGFSPLLSQISLQNHSSNSDYNCLNVTPHFGCIYLYVVSPKGASVHVASREKARNCWHLFRHSVIDLSRIAGGVDGFLKGGISSREGGQPRERGSKRKEEIRDGKHCNARNMDRNGAKGGVQVHRDINLSNYPDNGLEADNEPEKARRGGREVASCCLERTALGDGGLAEFMVPEGGMALRNIPIQFSREKRVFNVSESIRSPSQISDCGFDSSVREATPELKTDNDSEIFSAVSQFERSVKSALAMRLPRHDLEINKTAKKDSQFGKLDVESVFLWSQYNSNSNNNNNENGKVMDQTREKVDFEKGKQAVLLEAEGVRQPEKQQMGADGEQRREGQCTEGSAAGAEAAGVEKLQVGEGYRLKERRITKAEQEMEAMGGTGQDRGNIITTGREEKMEETPREEERHSSRGERSVESLIVDDNEEKDRGRSRRAANRHPHFPQYNYQVQVPENQPPGTSVMIMSASDPDPGDAGRVSYSMAPLMNSRSSDYFHIHPEMGLITTTQILDREHMDLHYFRITAADFGTPRLSGTTMVAIAVADRNDHSPIFEQNEYRETIRENVEEGYPILQLRATDLDGPANANIRYRFVGDSAAVARAAFEIDPRSGLITTRGAVDRETNEHYTLQVEASDQGKEPSPRSATVKVYISVLDENDNVPQFSEKRYVVAVKEDVRPHSEILRVSATDRDKDSNAAVHYNIISGNSRGQFSIDSVTGEIQVVAPLDYESEREYTLRVRAQDNGRPPLSNNTGIVSVQVTDVNDNPPIFVSTPFQASVLESATVGSSILHIQAIDTDSGDNARLEYRLTGTSSDTPFVINSATGWVTVKTNLDRESVEHYFFGVEARDYGMPPLSATASVTITVMDVNDNRPEFLQKEYYARLNEDAVVGTSVVTVTAVDRDVNSAVTYQITGGNTRNRFAISTAGGAGLLSLALPLDYKQERRYVLTVTASDRTLHDTCQVHINITDANTHRPVFQSAHYSVSVNEDRPPGSTVVVISATDDDVGENARITYFLDDNIPQFRIDPATGAITLQAELDYEDQMTYTLAITAKDNGIPQKSDTTYVEVNVNDVNDNAPQFLSPRYQGTVSEDAPPFTSVLQISATDRDAHANGRVQYTFQNGEDGDGDFTIEPTSGIVRTVRRLDRESVPFYELTAYAVDRGVPPQRTPIHIQVTISDVNDNAPVFPADDFEVLVKENSAVGSVVAQITATDPDEGANAQIMYQIVEGNIPEIFQMDIFSGELTSLIDLDYESRNEYVIVVQATSAPLVSRATVRIKLVDQNDNHPTLQNFQIIFNNFVSNRSNSFPSGVIGRVPAHDPDVSDRLFYTIDSGNELHLLLLNHTSGEIRLSRKLDNNRALVAPMMITVTGKRAWKEMDV